MRKYLLMFILFIFIGFGLYGCGEKYPHSLDTSVLDAQKAKLIKSGYKEEDIRLRRIKKDKLPSDLLNQNELIGTYIIEVKKSENDAVIKYYRNLECTFKPFLDLNKQDVISAVKSEVKNLVLAKLLVTNETEFGQILDNTKEMDKFAKVTDEKNQEVDINSYKVTEEEVNQLETTTKRFTPHFYTNDNAFLKNEVSNADFKDLYISKFLISSNHEGIRFVELFNPTDKEINLENYKLAIFSAEDTKPSHTINLRGCIKPNEVFQITSKKAFNSNLEDAKLQNLCGNNILQLLNPVNTYIDVIGNYASTLQGYNREGELFIRRTKRIRLYSSSDDATSLVDINHGVRLFNFDDWCGFVENYTKPITDKKHPVTTSDKPDFPSELLGKGNLNGGITTVNTLVVHDGDTAQFECITPSEDDYVSGKRIRYFLVDTPETEKPGHAGEPYAEKAKSFNKDLLDNANETYIMSPLKNSGKQEGYGRYLALVWVTNTITNVNGETETVYTCINLEIVRNGLIKDCYEGESKPNDYQAYNTIGNRHLYQWQREALFYAMSHKLGIFSGDQTVK